MWTAGALVGCIGRADGSGSNRWSRDGRDMGRGVVGTDATNPAHGGGQGERTHGAVRAGVQASCHGPMVRRGTGIVASIIIIEQISTGPLPQKPPCSLTGNPPTKHLTGPGVTGEPNRAPRLRAFSVMSTGVRICCVVAPMVGGGWASLGQTPP